MQEVTKVKAQALAAPRWKQDPGKKGKQQKTQKGQETMPPKNANDTPSVKSGPFTTPQAFHCSPPEPTPPMVQQDH